MDKERRGPLVLQEQPPLPEDPVAGKRSELQWQKHLQAEERERQMLFDRNRLAQHRELIKNIKAARERLDQPKTAKALQQAREQLEPTLQALQQSIDEVDRYKNSSHLLGDYDALMDALKQSYPQARLAAMSGKPEAQAQARSDFDARLRAMHAWLVRSEDLDEAAEEGE
jgi:FMN phosphatase YigB (HAD superfamily)